MGLTDTKITVKNEVTTCVMILAGTTLFSFLIYGLFTKLSRGPEELNIYYGFGFGAATGFLFMITFIIVGGLRNSFNIVIARWADFFANLQVSLGFSLSCYFDDVKHEGMVFWLYMLVMFIQFKVSYYCLDILIQYFLNYM